jgi:hypothetical protein
MPYNYHILSRNICCSSLEFCQDATCKRNDVTYYLSAFDEMKLCIFVSIRYADFSSAIPRLVRLGISELQRCPKVTSAARGARNKGCYFWTPLYGHSKTSIPIENREGMWHFTLRTYVCLFVHHFSPWSFTNLDYISTSAPSNELRNECICEVFDGNSGAQLPFSKHIENVCVKSVFFKYNQWVKGLPSIKYLSCWTWFVNDTPLYHFWHPRVTVSPPDWLRWFHPWY